MKDSATYFASPGYNGRGLQGQILRFVVLGAVVAAGVAVGIYSGVYLTSGTDAPDVRTLVRNQTLLDIGEGFPNYLFLDAERHETTSVFQVLAQGPCILIFMSQTCDMCDLLKAYWAKKVEPQLRSDIQIACVYDVTEWMTDETSGGATRLVRARLFTTDRPLQKQEDGIDAIPTLVALDREGTIKLVVTGFDRNIGADVLNRIL